MKLSQEEQSTILLTDPQNCRYYDDRNGYADSLPIVAFNFIFELFFIKIFVIYHDLPRNKMCIF